MSALLEVSALQTAYGTSQVLFGVSFALNAGEAGTLLGRNGMGKTTTVRSVLGLTASLAGTVRFRGESVTGLAPDRVARMGLALVPEGRQIFFNLSVKENLLAFAAQRNASETPWTLDGVYALFPRLAERSRHIGNQLSGGEQQMLAIGRADLAEDPQLANNAGRDARASEIDGVIDAWVGSSDADEVLRVASEAQVPSSPIFSVADMFRDPQFLARGMLESAQLPDGKDFHLPGVVPKLSLTPGGTRWIGPALGEHTDAVLQGLGYAPDEIDRFRQDGAI